MNKSLLAVLAVFIVLVFLIGTGALYTIDETKQVVVTRFGEPIGKPITESGLHYKMPFIDVANYFDKRILEWDGDPNEIPTRDKRYIWVDTTARWRIKDALKFMQSVRTESAAQGRLDDIIDGNTRDIISSNVLVEAVRNSNRLLTAGIEEESQQGQDVGKISLEKINIGREAVSKEILTRTSEQVLNDFGIELIDVRVKRINYINKVQERVFERMISERTRAAEQFRSEGQGKKAEIEGQMSKELKQIQAEAYKTAQEIKGKADAEAVTIFANAYNNDPDFYSFLKTLDTYKNTMNKDTILMLSTDNEFYSYLKGMNLKQ